MQLVNLNVKSNTCFSCRAVFALNTEHINVSKSCKIHENLSLFVTAALTTQEKTCQCVQQTVLYIDCMPPYFHAGTLLLI